jgi:fibro-slime domain-containing protein
VFESCGEWDTGKALFLCSTPDCSDEGTRIKFFSWITPYHNAGHWTQDLSPLLALFRTGDPLYVQVTGGYTYNFTIDFRFRDMGLDDSSQAVSSVFGGDRSHVWFDHSYDEEFPVVRLTPPAGTTRVALHGIVGGGGSAPGSSCAEFCTHQHQLEVNGQSFETEYEMETGEGGQYSCANRSRLGVTPNQGGTWYYDRGAWCPGYQVDPWVVDITEAVDLDGENTMRWHGTYNDGLPPGLGGNVWSDHKLVFYGADSLNEPTVEDLAPSPSCRPPVTVTLRDFSLSHPDFPPNGDVPDAAKGVVLGAVESQLVQDGDEWKPVYAWADDPSYGWDAQNVVPFSTADNFDQWWRDVPGVNFTTTVELQLNASHAGTANFNPQPTMWYPFEDDFGWGLEGSDKNKKGTAEIATTFTYEGGEVLRFVSWSDFWMFINHQKVADIGGADHAFGQARVDLDALADDLGLEIGETYDLHVFAADRGHNNGFRFELEIPDTCP